MFINKNVHSLKFIKMNKILFAIPILLIISFFFFTTTFNNVGSTSLESYETPQNDSLYGGVFLSENITENISYEEYKKYQSSFNNIKAQVDSKNNSNSYSSFSTLGIGVCEFENKNLFFNNYFSEILLKSKDSLFYKKEKQRLFSCLPPKINEKQYYFSLDGYELNDNFKKFFIVGKKNYLAVPVLNKKDTSQQNNYKQYHYERKEIGISYNTPDKKILFPISKTAKSILTAIIMLTVFILLIFTLSITIYLPYRIIKNISKGKPFAEQNIVELKFILKYSIIISLFSNLLPFLLHAVLYKWIPSDFKMINIENVFSKPLFSFLYCLVIYFIYKAFKKGYDLQAENELTV